MLIDADKQVTAEALKNFVTGQGETKKKGFELAH